MLSRVKSLNGLRILTDFPASQLQQPFPAYITQEWNRLNRLCTACIAKFNRAGDVMSRHRLAEHARSITRIFTSSRQIVEEDELFAIRTAAGVGELNGGNDIFVTLPSFMGNDPTSLTKDMARRCLEPGAWMHGNFIQAYIQVLTLRATNQYGSTYVFDNFWYSDALVKNGDYRYQKRTINARTKDLFEHDAFVAVIHVANNHFALAYGEFESKKISYMDSIPSGIGGVVLDNILKFCADEWGNAKKLAIFPSRANCVPFNGRNMFAGTAPSQFRREPQTAACIVPCLQTTCLRGA